MEEQRKLEEAQLAEEAALAVAEKEKARSKAALEHAEAAQRIAELEAQKKRSAEIKALKEAEEKDKVLDALAKSDVRYRKYSIEELETATENVSESHKIGEGGYGPVEVLSCIRHPNMVLLLGACPEYGCLIYKYMSNGSLEDCLLRRTPTLSWQHRFRIVAEIGTGSFAEMLDQTVPDWLVEEALSFAKMALKCAELRRKDRPDLGKFVMPELERLRALAEENMSHSTLYSAGQTKLATNPPPVSRFIAKTNIANHETGDVRHPTTPRPQVIVTPLDETHIQSALYCAKKHGLEIRIRSGGHDFEGASYISEDPFVILDLFKLNSITVDVENATAWVQSGATLGELYYAISKKSRTLAFPAGYWSTVGVGGQLSGGGYGALLRKYGLAGDNVIDAKFINVDGKILDRKSMGEDLFWALKGAGGGNFGVIVAFKIKLVAVPENVTVFKVSRTLEQNATKLVHKWQYVAPSIHEDLTITLRINNVKSSQAGKQSYHYEEDSKGKTSYEEASVWGVKYFKDNFKRLAEVKAMVDPDYFFRSEQTIPPLFGDCSTSLGK
ncbi:hypothetical protein RJ640_015860 [Escallonia rubra]|uniref:FAD-binding PCMH-type domain-containing protein n=1 Tax=Escallonia rubra TaxID=112253 RepID=A0AA88RMS5_9ASTE|nr:hypothetical protein RJ640_015860 [Escallonia rubra]